jgi:hypothetical protein
MNRSNAQARQTDDGWIGEFRPCWRARYEPVRLAGAHGEAAGPKFFATEAEAEAAAWRKLRDITEPVMFRTGAVLGQARAEAEKLFTRSNA